MEKVAIFGVPRSGTSWLSQIFNSHPDVVLRFQPLFSYGHKDRLSTHSSSEEIRSFYEEILYSQDPFATISSEMQKDHPTFLKTPQPTHIVFKETRYLHLIENMLTQCSEVKIIGIVRNPLAVLASWISAPKEFISDWDINKEWRDAKSKNKNKQEEFYGFDKWKTSTEEFLSLEMRFPEQFRIVGYKDLNNAPLDATRDVFHFCGLDICDQVIEFIVNCKSRHDTNPYSVFRANADDNRWKSILPDEIVREVLYELKHSRLEVFVEGVRHA